MDLPHLATRLARHAVAISVIALVMFNASLLLVWAEGDGMLARAAGVLVWPLVIALPVGVAIAQRLWVMENPRAFRFRTQKWLLLWMFLWFLVHWALFNFWRWYLYIAPLHAGQG